MPRRCHCARLLAALHTDPRLRTLPLAARMLWMLLAEAMVASETQEPGVLPFGSAARVSLLVAAPETDVETHLETLIGEGLLERLADGRLACPMLRDGAPRATAARQNGGLGGRPRRGETAEQARARKQSEMLLALPRPRDPDRPDTPSGETQETQAGNPAGKPSRMMTEESSIPSSSSTQLEAARDALALARECADLAGFDPARHRWDKSPIERWLAAGATPDMIRSTVAELTGRAKSPPKTFAYFDGTILERAALERAAPAPKPLDADRAAWLRAMEESREPNRFPPFDAWMQQRKVA